LWLTDDCIDDSDYAKINEGTMDSYHEIEETRRQKAGEEEERGVYCV